MNRKARRAGRAKIFRNLTLILPDPSVTNVSEWVMSLSPEQMERVARFLASDDPTENTVPMLAIVAINGGEMLEEELHRQFNEAVRFINARLRVVSASLRRPWRKRWWRAA